MTDDKPSRGIVTPAMEAKMRRMLDTDDQRAPGVIWVQFSVDHEGGDICVEDIHLEDPPKYHTVRYVRAAGRDDPGGKE